MNKLMLASVAMTSLAAAAASPPRGIAAAPRAEAPTDPKALLAQIQASVDEMRKTSEERLGKVEAKIDPLDIEKIKAMDANINRLEEALDKALAASAAANLNGGKAAPRDPEYTDQFLAYMRSGAESQQLLEVKAAATKTNGEGGFLAPVEWDRTIAGSLKQVSAIRREASVQSISGAGFTKTFSNRNVGSGWVGETAARPETTTPTLSSLAFPLGELYANPAASQGLIDDAEVDIEQWLADEVALEFDRQEGIAFLSGDGVNKPHGLLTYVTGGANAARHPFGAIATVNSGAAALPTGDGVLSLIYALPEEFENNAKLFMNRTTAGSIRRLKDTTGQYLWQPALGEGQPATLAGAPIVHMPGMPAVAANAVAMLYGDMRETYQVVDRIGIRVLRDPYTNKPFVHFYTTKRVGGGVKNPEAMKAMVIAA